MKKIIPSNQSEHINNTIFQNFTSFLRSLSSKLSMVTHSKKPGFKVFSLVSVLPYIQKCYKKSKALVLLSFKTYLFAGTLHCNKWIWSTFFISSRKVSCNIDIASHLISKRSESYRKWFLWLPESVNRSIGTQLQRNIVKRNLFLI